MKKAVLFGCASLLILCSAALFAQEQNIDVDVDADAGGEHQVIKIRKGGDIEHIMFDQKETLNLTDEQHKQFKKIDLAFEKDILSTKNELEVARLELDVELDEDNPDLKKINGLIDSIHDKEAAIEKKRIANELKKRDLLTDEQKKNWTLHGPHMKKQIIMMRGDGPGDLMWFGDDDLSLPTPPKIRKEKRIITK